VPKLAECLQEKTGRGHPRRKERVVMKRSMLVIAFSLLLVGSVRAENWSVAVGGNIGKVEVTEIDGKVYADAQTLLTFLGYNVSIDAGGKVIAIENKQKAEVTPDEFDSALRSLKDISSAAKVGVNSLDYSKMVRDSQISVDRFADKFGAENPNTKNLRTVLAIYLDANDLWQQGLKEGSKSEFNIDEKALYLTKRDDVVKELLKKYPDLKKMLENTFFTQQLSINRGLSFLWTTARAKVDETKRVPETVSPPSSVDDSSSRIPQ